MRRFNKADLVNLFKYIVFTAAFVAVVGLFGIVRVSAEDEGDSWTHYVGVANGTVNVRSGPGVEYDQVMDSNKKTIQLSAQEEVTIIDEAASKEGKIWYKIVFTRDGVEYTGFATSSYVSKDEERTITPSPTPSPLPTPTLSPTPTVAPTEPVEPTKELMPEKQPSSNSKDSLLRAILIVIIIAIVVLIALIVLKLMRDNKSKNGNIASRKVDKLKRMSLDNQDNNRKLPQIKKIESDSSASVEVRQDVYYKKTYDYSATDDLKKNAERDSDEKKALRAAIERLQEHDIVYHTIYGEGEVYDNSDVKLLEVRFGNDMRFLKKDQLVARHELLIIDEEEQSIAKRRNKRKTTRS